jgi:succinate dehydrogenase / fumarate reductase, cytochrome b subunit
LRCFECGLLFAILFHTFNGLRLLGIDLGNLCVETSRRLLLIAVALTAVVGLAGSVVILKPVFA